MLIGSVVFGFVHTGADPFCICFCLDPIHTLKCQINGGGGPNNQGGWKNFRNLIDGGSEL